MCVVEGWQTYPLLASSEGFWGLVFWISEYKTFRTLQVFQT